MSAVDAPTPSEGAAKGHNAFQRLYRGETSFDFVGRRRWWFLISGVIILAGMISLATRGLNFGIDFQGGQQWQVEARGLTVPTVTRAVQGAGLSDPTVQILGGRTVEVTANLNGLPPARQAATKTRVAAALGQLAHIPPAKVPSTVSVTDVGATWGSDITNKAIIAVVVFFAVVVAYLSFRFEWKMAIAALIAVMHDILVVIGVYSLSGFQVTSDVVIAVLTILGYSLYDTVVVFDRVADNAKGLGASGRMTYTDVVNLSMNQTLARSINTTLVAILPVLSILIIGAQILGATTLQDFGLALVIGLASGAYSSIFIASPVLAWMKEREPRYASIRQKLASRADRTGLLTPRAAAALATAGGTAGARGRGRAAPAKGAGRGRPSGAAARGGVLRPGAAGAARQAAVTEVETPEAARGSDKEGDGRGDGQLAPRRSPGAAKRPAGSGAQPRRPGPRPRKGKGSRKGRRR